MSNRVIFTLAMTPIMLTANLLCVGMTITAPQAGIVLIPLLVLLDLTMYAISKAV